MEWLWRSAILRVRTVEVVAGAVREDLPSQWVVVHAWLSAGRAVVALRGGGATAGRPESCREVSLGTLREAKVVTESVGVPEDGSM